MSLTEDQLKKLPKYAQREIQRLERNLESSEEMVREVFGKGNSPITLRPFTDKIKIPDETIRFDLGNGPHDNYIEVRIDRDIRGTSLYLMGSYGLRIHSESGNTIRVTAERFGD